MTPIIGKKEAMTKEIAGRRGKRMAKTAEMTDMRKRGGNGVDADLPATLEGA